MQHFRRLGQFSLLALSMLSACAAADPPRTAHAGPGYFVPSGVFGRYLAGRHALAHSDPGLATDQFLKGLAARPGDRELQQQAFMAAVMGGRPEAVQLAQQLPADNQVAQLLLGNEAARTGHWQVAQQRFQALSRQGVTQLLQPVLLAWAQQGAGQTDAALATLQPLMQGQRYRGIFTLHAAMIADLAGRRADAGRLYTAAQAEMPEMSLRLAQVLASWQARNGNPDQARRILANLGSGSPEVAISLPGLNRVVGQRAVSRATDGLAEAYLELAAALRPQESGDFAMVMTRLALALRPDFTAARLLASEIQAGRHHDAAALQLLAVVPAADPLAPLVRLRRAALTDRTGHTEEAMQALDHLAAEYPNSPAPLIERGDLLRARKHFKEAIGVYTRALAHIQESRDVEWLVLYSRGISYERSGEWPLGEADLRHALRLSPDQPSVLNYLGYSWAERGEHLKEAREMIQKAAERRPHDGAIVDSLGWVMLRQGEVAAAVHMLERAVELEPEDPTITAHLGDAYWAAGRKLEAQYQWRRALTLNPTADDVVKLEAKLQAPQKASVVSGQ